MSFSAVPQTSHCFSCDQSAKIEYGTHPHMITSNNPWQQPDG